MSEFLALSLPLFAVVGIGFALVRRGVFPHAATQVLGDFAYWIALPALVLRTIAHLPLDRTFSAPFYGGYLASGAAVFALTLWASRGLAGGGAAGAAHATAATVSNLGYIGLPLMLALFGARGAGPLAMGILSEVAVLMAVGIVLMDRSRSRNQGDSGATPGIARRLLRMTMLNPVVLAIAAGVALAGSGTALPALLDRFLAFVGPAAGPAALFALGGVLAGISPARLLWPALGLTAAKLLLYPLVAHLVLGRVLRLETFWVQAGTLIAALPMAGSTLVLAQQQHADPDTVGAAIAISTAVAAITFPVTAWLVLS